MGGKLLGVLALLLGGCLPPSGGGGTRCTEGEVRSCSCAGDQMGLQHCGENSRYGDCVCDPGGAGGASGAGGAVGDANGLLPPTALDLSSPRLLRDGGSEPTDASRALTDARSSIDFGRPAPDFGPADFGRPPPDFGPPDFGAPPPDFGGPRPRDAGAIPDAHIDAADIPIDAGSGPECRERDDCDRACEWLRACFGDRQLCSAPSAAFAANVEEVCRENCALLTARLCRLRSCADLNRAAPGLGDDWRRQCSD